MLVAAGCAACSRSGNATNERVALLPFENLTGDTALDWISAAGPKIVTDQLLGGAARIVPILAGSLRDAYGSGATQVVHGYFEKRFRSNPGETLHFEFVLEDARTHKALQTIAGDGGTLTALDRLAKQIDTNAHAFSSTNSGAVAAWGSGDYEKAVSLDPGFGAAWSSWVQARTAAGDKQRASELVTTALGQASLQSPVDRAQLEFAAATLRQDESAQQQALLALSRLMPHDAAVLRRLAAQQMSTRHFPEAARYYGAALQEDPDDSDTWNLVGYAQAFAGDLASAQKSLERYGRDPAHAANALDSRGEASFLNGKFAEAEKFFLEAQAKSALLDGSDLLKAAYARWLQGDLPGADQLFVRYLTIRTQQKDRLIPWRQAVWEYSTGRSQAALARLSALTSSVTGPEANLVRAQLAVWKDPSKLPHDPAALKQIYDRAPPVADGIPRVLYAEALARTGQKDEARKLLVLWPLPAQEGDPLLQSFLFPKYLELKRELK